MRHRLFTIALTIILAAGCNLLVIRDGGIWVQGLAVDRAGKPVPNVLVKAYGSLYTSVTDQNGCFQLLGVAPYGTHEINTASTEAAIGRCDVTRPGQGSPGFTPPAVVARTYREIDGVALQAFVFAPSGKDAKSPASAILLFHGGGWADGSPDWTFAAARRFAAAGLVAISVEYRLSNERTTPADALADVCESFHWVREEATNLGVHPQRIAASGVSAGGHLAAAAATVGCGNTEGEYGIGGPDALVLSSPALDVSGDADFRRLLRDRATVQAYSPVEHVRPRMPPTHIVHGDRDTLTPRGSKRFCDSVRAGGGVCELVVYPTVDPAAQDDANSRQLAFVRALWRTPAPLPPAGR